MAKNIYEFLCFLERTPATWDNILLYKHGTMDYNAYTGTEAITITVTDKITATLESGVTQSGCTYGTELANPSYTAPTGTINRVITYAGTLAKDGTAYSGNTKPSEAGSYTVTVTCETATHIYSATSAAFTIARQSINGMTVALSDTEKTYNGSSQSVTVSTVGSPALNAETDYTVSGATSGKDATTYQVTVTGKGNYQGTANASWRIAPRALTIASAAVSSKGYDGNANATVESVSFTGLEDGETLAKGTDYTVTNARFPDANADGSNVDVTMTVRLVANGPVAKNYSLSSGNYTAASAAKINKVNYTGTIATEKTVLINRAQTGVEADLAALISGITGAAISAVSESADAHALISNVSRSGSKVTFDVASIAEADKTATIAATISSTNYNDFTATVTVRTIAKTDISDSITFADGRLTYTGSALRYERTSVSGASGGSWTYTYVASGGNASLLDGKPISAGTYAVTAKYEDADHIGTKTATLTVDKATPTGSPKYTEITTDNKTLADAALRATDGAFSVEGSVKWIDASGNDLADTTVVEVNTSYRWLFTPDDTNNYNTKTGTLTPYWVFAGNEDGDFVVRLGRIQNGSVTVSPETASQGDMVRITAVPDDGFTLARLAVIDEYGREIRLTRKGGNRSTFQMPASDVTVLATFEEESAALQGFVDVPESKYFYDAVLWAVENGITGGVDETHFAPYASCTRGQLVTFLWRAAGEPTARNARGFTDVARGRYCEDAVAWAAKNNIVGGYDDGTFRPDATVTRQQTAAILWRFAKYADMDVTVGEDTNILSYKDALSVSDYAFPAIQWAVGAGVMGGSNGRLLPRDTCNRAQIVTMLYRSIAK